MSKVATALTEEELEEFVRKFFGSAMTFGDLRGIGEKDLAAVYSIAYGLYNNGQFENAEKVFQFLCFYGHLEKKHWMGLAATRQMLKKFEDACQAYGMAALLDPGDPRPPLHAADCFLALGRYKEAESALSGALHFAGEKPEYEDVRQRARTLLSLLENKREG